MKTIIFDFDSTFIKCETLDTLAKIIYRNSEQLAEITHAIEEATRASMAGELSIHASLVSRIKALNITKSHISEAVDFLRQEISESFDKNRDFIQEHNQDIFIFSGGFTEIIQPIVTEYNILSENIFANTFLYQDTNIVGLHEDCLMAHNMGKTEQLKRLNRQGPVFVIGDGATDAEIKAAGSHVKFYLFAENVLRANLKEKADSIIYKLDEFITAEFS